MLKLNHHVWIVVILLVTEDRQLSCTCCGNSNFASATQSPCSCKGIQMKAENNVTLHRPHLRCWWHRWHGKTLEGKKVVSEWVEVTGKLNTDTQWSLATYSPSYLFQKLVVHCQRKVKWLMTRIASQRPQEWCEWQWSMQMLITAVCSYLPCTWSVLTSSSLPAEQQTCLLLEQWFLCCPLTCMFLCCPLTHMFLCCCCSAGNEDDFKTSVHQIKYKASKNKQLWWVDHCHSHRSCGRCDAILVINHFTLRSQCTTSFWNKYEGE